MGVRSSLVTRYICVVLSCHQIDVVLSSHQMGVWYSLVIRWVWYSSHQMDVVLLVTKWVYGTL